jgi:uncharacterized protein YhaN
MMHARRLQLLREIRNGGDHLTANGSLDDRQAAWSKLMEWQKLAERLDIKLETSYTLRRWGSSELQFARATLTPSGSQLLEGARG